MLIWTTNSKVGNGLQTDRVKTGRDTLRRHIDGGQGRSLSGAIHGWRTKR